MIERTKTGEAAPLDRMECERIWAWETLMVRYYTFAMIMISLAVFLLWGFGTEPWARVTVVAGVVALMIAGAWVQFRERCPRCTSLLGRQSRFMLPMKCKVCKVDFPRRPKRGPATEIG
jgi:hypothetical protein